MRILLAALALVLIALRALAQSAPVTPSVTIPNFFDPRARIERPATGTVTSVRFLTTDDDPPFNFVNDRGVLSGFNVDLARAICAELQVPCTIQARAFDDLSPHLADKTADAIIAGVAITPQARAAMDFSDVYLRLPARFVARKGDATGPINADTLKGVNVAVVLGSAHAAYLAAMFPAAAAKAYPTADAARLALKAGEVKLAFGDGEQLGFWLQSDGAGGCCSFAGGPYLNAGFFGEGYAIAVGRGATDLRHALNAAMQAIADKGIYADLYLRYFPVGFF